ncbi:patatin-like phospholipase family protein [Actinoplanes sp. NPDC049599]|uniref:patatin-like phospholipase family protein n=1 Tax=Actinoplanes sp. NPDC049599 TaxID=3363903 RepID=UPI003792C501
MTGDAARSIFRRDTVEALARAFHRVYTSAPDPQGARHRRDDWDELPEVLKESNRDLARDVGDKARRIGCAVEPGTEGSTEIQPDEVEILARREHQRWMRHLRRAGWRWADGPADVTVRTSPYLVSWGRLSEAARELDRRMIRSLPQVLGGAGLHLARVGTDRAPETAPLSPAAVTEPADPADRAPRSVPEGDTPAGAAEVLSLVAGLRAERQWSRARQVVRSALGRTDLDPAERRKLRQLLAVCTYKDSELRLLPALESGLAALAADGDDLRRCQDPETLGIAGAIHKRMWDVGGGREHLDMALGYYLRGVACADGIDQGYTMINAAFLLDVLADQDERAARHTGLPAEQGAERRARAVTLRTEILERYGPAAATAAENATAGRAGPDVWWLVATVAEAAFGTGDYTTAGRLLAGAERLPTLPDWQLESTARQLMALAQLRPGADGRPDPAALRIVADLVGRQPDQLTTLTGRVGLALSGGGFRASFFHLGVLARLAELDVLRHVEVLSCVSGGSIVGAHYYLELRRRMQRHTDTEMTRDEYVDIVRAVQRDFVAATRRNLRRRALTNPVAVLKTVFVPGYNRTEQVARLLDRYFYRPVLHGEEPVLGELGITPVEGPQPFDPRRHNWRRCAKVPLLILNASTMNTGHNWQFTTGWMGEPYAFIDDRVDANYRLGRITLATAEEGDPKMLGQAVAASASVPGLLAPLRLDRIYPGKSIRLVDGGCVDNHGVFGLLEEDCQYLIVSDASGQMNAEDRPADGAFATLRRSNSILMSAIRNTLFTELDAMRRSGRLRGVLHLHLKRDLHGEVITADAAAVKRPDTDAGTTDYGMPRAVQRHIAGLRTDLNVFTRAEVSTLMLSGYRMTAASFGTDLPGFPVCTSPPVHWDFQDIALAVDAPPGSPRALALAGLLGMDRQHAWLSPRRGRAPGTGRAHPSARRGVRDVVVGRDRARPAGQARVR